MTLVEERVVLFRARSHDEALSRAEKEGSRYCTQVNHRNPYGQPVVYRQLAAMDSFELFEVPASGSEVYSRTEVSPRSVSDTSVLRALLGPETESKRLRASRRNILDITFNAPAPGVTRTTQESDLLSRGRRRLGRRP